MERGAYVRGILKLMNIVQNLMNYKKERKMKGTTSTFTSVADN